MCRRRRRCGSCPCRGFVQVEVGGGVNVVLARIVVVLQLLVDVLSCVSVGCPAGGVGDRSGLCPDCGGSVTSRGCVQLRVLPKRSVVGGSVTDRGCARLRVFCRRWVVLHLVVGVLLRVGWRSCQVEVGWVNVILVTLGGFCNFSEMCLSTCVPKASAGE